MRLSPLELLVIVVVFLLVFGNWPKLVKDGARRLSSLKKSFSDASSPASSSVSSRDSHEGIDPPEVSSESKVVKKVGSNSSSHGSPNGEGPCKKS